MAWIYLIISSYLCNSSYMRSLQVSKDLSMNNFNKIATFTMDKKRVTRTIDKCHCNTNSWNLKETSEAWIPLVPTTWILPKPQCKSNSAIVGNKTNMLGTKGTLVKSHTCALWGSTCPVIQIDNFQKCSNFFHILWKNLGEHCLEKLLAPMLYDHIRYSYSLQYKRLS